MLLIQDASAQFEPLTLKPGEKKDMVLPGEETKGERYIHGWADASGNAAPWVKPTHIDFGELGPREYTERPYTIRVPENQSPGVYELIWIYNCETLYSDTTECAGGQVSIKITIIGCPDFTITFMPPASDPRGVIFEPNDRGSFDLRLAWAGEIPSQAKGLKVQYQVAASTTAEKPGEVGSSILPKFALNPVTMYGNRLNDVMEVVTRDAPPGTYPLTVKAIVQDPETGLTCSATTTVVLVVGKSSAPPPITTPPPPPKRIFVSYAGTTAALDLSGIVQIKKSSSTIWKPADKILSLDPGDTIRVGANGSVELFLDNERIKLGPNTELYLNNPEKAIIDLEMGKLRIYIEKGQKPVFQIMTPTVCAGCVGTRGTEFAVEVGVDGSTTVIVLEGTVPVQDLTSGHSVSLTANQQLVVPKTLEGLSEQAMQQSIITFDPNTIDKWWIIIPSEQSDISVSMKHKKKVTLVSVKNNGDEEIFAVQMKIKDGKITFVKVRGWDRDRVDQSTVIVLSNKPLRPGQSLILMLVVDNKGSGMEWTAFDASRNMVSKGDVMPKS